MSFKTVSWSSLANGIVRLGLARPKVNAFNVQMLTDTRDAFAAAAADPNVKAVLVGSDNIKCFSAGLDLSELFAFIQANDKKSLRAYVELVGAAFLAPSKCLKPVCAAVDGHAIAGSFSFNAR
jgi:enoyl-CoA hydratase/carnithine racemase